MLKDINKWKNTAIFPSVKSLKPKKARSSKVNL